MYKDMYNLISYILATVSGVFFIGGIVVLHGKGGPIAIQIRYCA